MARAKASRNKEQKGEGREVKKCGKYGSWNGTGPIVWLTVQRLIAATPFSIKEPTPPTSFDDSYELRESYTYIRYIPIVLNGQANEKGPQKCRPDE